MNPDVSRETYAPYMPDFPFFLMNAAQVYLDDIRQRYQFYQTMGERALDQVSDADLFTVISAESNSLAILMKHLAGNMRSRFTDFLTTDGEKPDRHRDTEFDVDDLPNRQALMAYWQAGWAITHHTLHTLTPEDLTKTVTIRAEPHTVIAALNRQLNHYAYHVGQMVLLAKHFCRENWQSLSIPRGKSQQFNEQMFGRRV